MILFGFNVRETNICLRLQTFKDIYDLIKTIQETHKTFLTILQSHPMLKGFLRKANNDVHSRINTQL